MRPKTKTEETLRRNGMRRSPTTRIGRIFWTAGYAEKQERGFVWTAVAGKTVEVLRMLLPLYLSRSVLASAFEGRGIDDMLTGAVLVTVSYFLLTVLSGYCQRKANYHYHRFMKKHQVNKALTILEMNYEESERDEVQNELAAIKQMERTAAMGIRTFQESLSVLFANSIGIAAGIYLVRDLFLAPVTGVDPRLSLGLNLGYLGLMFFLHTFAVKIDVKTMRVYGDTAKHIFLRNHRYLQQYSELLFDYKVGKDIRLYCEPLGTHYNEVYRIRSSETYNVFFRLFSVSGAKRNFLSGLISVLTALFVGCRTLWGSVALSDVFLCIGVLELLFRHIEELTESFSKIISSDVVRSKWIRLFLDHQVMDAEAGEEGDTETATDSILSAENDVVELAIEPMTNGKRCEEQVDSPREVPTVEFRNVSFRYPNSDILVLNKINLKIFGKQKLALVGVNGSGKTTLIKLLLGLYAPTRGKILVCGEDTASWSPERFAAYFSVVFQDFKLFSFTLGENVAGGEDFDASLVAECLEKTGLSHFYEQHGADRFLYRDFEEGGVEISGGEAQKIAMARSIYHGGHFFVLDEPTAALDPLSEYEIYTHFGEITVGSPAIYISHRLSSCIFCDVVAVMEDGKIVQVGGHEELLADSEGVYSKLWNAQAKHYQAPSAS